MHRRTRTVPLFAFGIVLLAMLLGCASLNSGPDSAQSGGASSLVVDLESEPATLDPGLQYDTSSYSVYRNIFDQLLRREKESQEIVPWIATSWERRSPTEWTFKIRDGVKFHDGSDLTASDAAYSLNRILNPDLASPQSANFGQVESADASGNTLNITTKTPSPTLLDQLVNLSVVPEDYVEKVGDEQFNLKPVGSGAYELQEWSQGNEVRLTAYGEYWKQDPEIKNVRFRFVPNGATRVADLQSGEAQIAFALTPDDARSLEGSDSLEVLSTPTERVAYLALNALKTPTESAEVRQAIAHAIDKEELASSLLEGYAEPVDVPLTPPTFGFSEDVEGYAYDPQRSKELLREAGYTEGLKLAFATSPAYDQRIVEAVQADLKEVGIDVEIASTDFATYLQKIQDPAHDWGSIRFGEWSCACLDADGTLYQLFHTGTIWSSYSDEEFDRVIEAARTTFDTAERKRLYEEALRILQNDMPAVGLWQSTSIYGASKDLQWQPDIQETFFVQDMEL